MIETATAKQRVWKTKEDAAQHVPCSTRTLENWMKKGLLKEGVHYKKLGYKKVVFDIEQLDNFSF